MNIGELAPPNQRPRTCYRDLFTHLPQGELDGLEFSFQGVNLVRPVRLVGSLYELRKDPSAGIPAKLLRIEW
jgi:hypothetical protein